MLPRRKSLVVEPEHELVWDIPELFCWSKMGAEAGEELTNILIRKDLERRLGEGFFAWGIGNSIGNDLNTLWRPGFRMPIIFSQMISKPKAYDRKPSAVWLWRGYLDDRGIPIPLPWHVIVTSRAKQATKNHETAHYALFCRSSRELTIGTPFQLDASGLSNAVSGKPLGFSQVTAIVRYSTRRRRDNTSQIYPVNALAELIFPHCVRLCSPIQLSKEMLALLAHPDSRGSLNNWKSVVSKVHEWASRKNAGFNVAQREFTLY